LQKSLVQQAHFVNQQVLPRDQGPDATHDNVTTQGEAAAFHAEVTAAFLAPKAEAGRP
jgi:hypothetical protein